MATAKPSVVSMRLSSAGAIACRPSTYSAPLLHRVSAGLSLAALQQRFSARFTSILSSAYSPRSCLNVVSIHAQDPDFYKIPYAEGIPVGKRLKLWNLPPDCKHSELLEWFAGVDVVVESLEFTNDPALNAQGIGGFVEFATKQHACIAIVRLDGYKFRGHYIRMDFAEKRPRPRDYGSRGSRANQNSSNSSNRGSFATSSRPPVRGTVPSYGGTSSSNVQSTPRYGAAITNSVLASSNQSSITNPNSVLTSSPSRDAPSNPSYGSSQSAPSYSTTSNIAQPSPIYNNTGSTSSHTNQGSSSKAPTNMGAGSSPGPTPNSQAKTHLRYRNSAVQPVHSNGDDGMKSKSDQVPVIQGYSPSSSYASYGKIPYDDPFKDYGAPDQAVVEPWSNKASFRSGPMYGSPQPSSFNRLFVGNLALSVDDATLQHLFSGYGTVLEARVLRDSQSGRSRGFGFVAMSNLEEMKAAYQALDGQLVESHPIKVDAVALAH